MKKYLILLGILGLLCSGCSIKGDVEDSITDTSTIVNSVSDSTVHDEDNLDDLNKLIGQNIADIIDNTDLIEMTDEDHKALEDAIGVYLIIDSTMKEAPIKYWFEKSSDGANNVVVTFEKSKSELPEGFKTDLIDSINGALSVTPPSIQYSDLNVLIYDVDGTVYIAESYKS